MRNFLQLSQLREKHTLFYSALLGLIIGNLCITNKVNAKTADQLDSTSSDEELKCKRFDEEFDFYEGSFPYVIWKNYRKDDYQIRWGDEVRITLDHDIGQHWLTLFQENYDYDINTLNDACRGNVNQQYAISLTNSNNGSTWKIMLPKNVYSSQNQIKDGDTIILQNVPTGLKLHSQACRALYSPLESQVAGNSGDNINHEWIIKIDSDTVSETASTWTVRSRFHLQHRATGWILHTSNRPLSTKSDRVEVTATSGELATIPFTRWRAEMHNAHRSDEKSIQMTGRSCSAGGIEAKRHYSLQIIDSLENRLRYVDECLLTHRPWYKRLQIAPEISDKLTDNSKSLITDKDLYNNMKSIGGYLKNNAKGIGIGLVAAISFDIVGLVSLSPDITPNLFTAYVEELRRRNLAILSRYRSLLNDSDEIGIETACAELEQILSERTGKVLLAGYRAFYEQLAEFLEKEKTLSKKRPPTLRIKNSVN